MKLLTKAIETKLRKNKQKIGTPKCSPLDLPPVVKFFGGSACTWLFTHMTDDNRLFGLCDLGQGNVELGYVSLDEISKVKFRPFGLGVERDKYFTATKSLRSYKIEAEALGRINA